MNKNKMFLATGLCAALASAAPMLMPLHADEGHASTEMKGMKGMKEEKMKIPATADGIWDEIHKEHAELDEMVKGKKLEHVHHHAFAIRDLAKALAAKAPAKKKEAAKAAVKKIAKLAAELDKSGDAKDQVATEVNLKKFDGALDELQAQFEKK